MSDDSNSINEPGRDYTSAHIANIAAIFGDPEQPSRRAPHSVQLELHDSLDWLAGRAMRGDLGGLRVLVKTATHTNWLVAQILAADPSLVRQISHHQQVWPINIGSSENVPDLTELRKQLQLAKLCSQPLSFSRRYDRQTSTPCRDIVTRCLVLFDAARAWGSKKSDLIALVEATRHLRTQLRNHAQVDTETPILERSGTILANQTEREFRMCEVAVRSQIKTLKRILKIKATANHGQRVGEVLEKASVLSPLNSDSALTWRDLVIETVSAFVGGDLAKNPVLRKLGEKGWKNYYRRIAGPSSSDDQLKKIKSKRKAKRSEESGVRESIKTQLKSAFRAVVPRQFTTRLKRQRPRKNLPKEETGLNA